MARILVSYFRSDEVSVNETLCFFDSFFKELTDCGNDVLAINNAYYGIFNPNRTNNLEVRDYLLKEAIKFDPELIITFNHRILQEILDEFEDIPVVIYDGDELRFFSDLDVIKENINRYKVFSIVENWRKDYLDFGFKDNQIFYLPPGTSVKKDSEVVPTMNISFLGQRRFFLSSKLKNCIQEGRDIDKIYNMYLDFLKTHDYSYENIYRRNMAYNSDVSLSDADLWPLFDQSYLIFANLLDLGLHLGGHEAGWRDIVDFIPQIATVHSKARVFTLEENQNFYNSSILSLCPMHPQAQGKGYSWRCYDIMASNACLVPSYSSELKREIKEYVDLPMFNTPQEARDICKKLLDDEPYRKSLVEASQHFIEDNGRWIDRIRKMENILNMKLIFENKKGELKKLVWHPAEWDARIPQRVAIVEDSPMAMKEQIISLGDRIQRVIINPLLLVTLFIAVLLNGSVLWALKYGMFDSILNSGFIMFFSYAFAFLTIAFIIALEGCIIYKFAYRVIRKILA